MRRALYHYVGGINIIGSFHPGQSGESNPRSLRCGKAHRLKNHRPTFCNIVLPDNAHIHYNPCCCYSNKHFIFSPPVCSALIERFTYRIMEIDSNFGIWMVFNNVQWKKRNTTLLNRGGKRENDSQKTLNNVKINIHPQLECAACDLKSPLAPSK